MKKIIVMHDFSPLGESALRYAMNLNKETHAELTLVHLVSKESQLNDAIRKMDAIVTENQHASLKPINKIVTLGSIFYSMGRIAKEEGAQLIIMGVKNTSGFQKLFRSNAIKVISSTEVPFLLVQKETVFRKVSKMIVPIDTTKESLQIVHNASELASIFNAVIHVVAQKQMDETHSQQIKNRLLLVKKQYEERHVPSVFELLPQSGSFQKQISEYVTRTQSDLIALAYHSESLLPQFDNFAQDLISNNQYIPCMVLNSKLASALYF